MRSAIGQFISHAAHAVAAVSVAWVLTYSPPAAGGKSEDRDEARTYTVGKWAYRRLSKAHEALGAERYAEALELMGDMLQRARLNDHEKALMWQTFGYIHSASERYDDAIASFEKCVAVDALPAGAANITQFNLGQLYVARERYPEAIASLEVWLQGVENPKPQAVHLLAIAHAQNKSYKEALSYAQRAVDGSKKVPESWLQLLLSLHYQLQHKRQVAEVLQTLVQRFPKKTYWLQLSAAYQEQGRDSRALATLQLAYVQGLLGSAREQANLAQLYLYHELPYKAATLLQGGLGDGPLERDAKTLEMLANAWIRARELDRAVVPLQSAAELAESGDLFVQLGRVFLEREAFGEASAALGQGLLKETLTDRPNAQLLLGIASYRGGDHQRARRAFAKAQSHDKTRKSAEQWQAVMRADVSRRAGGPAR